MIKAFAGVMISFLLLLAVVLLFDPGDFVLLVLVLLLIVAVGFAVRLQFSAGCPSCGYCLGLQTRLLLPASCECCGASLGEESQKAEGDRLTE